jgi:hypothetical protein
MATTYTYQDILKRVESNGALNPMSSAGEQGTAQFQIPQLQPIDFPMKDLDYESTFKITEQDITKVLAITKDSVGFTNIVKTIPQILLNSNRITINSKRDYLMLFGKAGVSISSGNAVNLDSDSSTTLAAKDGVYLGVPNNGQPIAKETKKPKTKGDPTPDQPYEPLVLGIKAANIIEDLLVVIKNARIVTPVGLGYFREDAQYDLANLQARLPEILSTSTFIDGVSHESTDKPPDPPATITNTTGTFTGILSGGSFGGGGGFTGGGGNDAAIPPMSNQDITPMRKAIIDVAYSFYANPDRLSENPADNLGWANPTFQNNMSVVGWRQGSAWCNFFTNLVWKQAYDKVSATDQEIAKLYKQYLKSSVYGVLSGNVFATLTNAIKGGFGKRLNGISYKDPVFYDYVRPGDMIVYTKGHINIAYSVDYTNYKINTIGGNEGNQVKYYTPFNWGGYTVDGIVRVVEPLLFSSPQVTPTNRAASPRANTNEKDAGKPPTVR